MKKYLAILAIVALVSGCAFLQTAQDTICNPPQSVITVANAAAPLVAIAINMAGPGSAAYVNAVTVQGAITAIQGGACVSLTQLNALIAWLQSDEAQTLQTKAMIKVGPMKAVAINVQPLIDWRDSR
jgi:hypothetical protein